MSIDALIEKIETADYHDVSASLTQLGEMNGVTEEDLFRLMDSIPILVEAFSRQYEIHFKGQTIVWFDYEHLIWYMGESFRRIIKRQKKLRRKESLFSKVETVCRETRYKKGRESFTMLMGHYGGSERISVLIDLLDDPEVAGHAVYALRLLGAREAAEKIRPFLDHEKTWVRNQAKKYFKKMEKLQSGKKQVPKNSE